MDTPLLLISDPRWLYYFSLYANAKGKKVSASEVMSLTLRKLMSEGQSDHWVMSPTLSAAKLGNYLAQRIFVRSDENVNDLGYTGNKLDLPDVKMTDEMINFRQALLSRVLATQKAGWFSNTTYKLSDQDIALYKSFYNDDLPGTTSTTSTNKSSWEAFVNWAIVEFNTEKSKVLHELTQTHCSLQGTLRFQLATFSNNAASSLDKFNMAFSSLRVKYLLDINRFQKDHGATMNNAGDFKILDTEVHGFNQLEENGSYTRATNYAEVLFSVMTPSIHREVRSMMSSGYVHQIDGVSWMFTVDGTQATKTIQTIQQLDPSKKDVVLVILKGEKEIVRDEYGKYIRENICMIPAKSTSDVSNARMSSMSGSIHNKPNEKNYQLIWLEKNQQRQDMAQQFEQQLSYANQVDPTGAKARLIKQERNQWFKNWKKDIEQLQIEFNKITMDFDKDKLFAPDEDTLPFNLTKKRKKDSTKANRSSRRGDHDDSERIKVSYKGSLDSGRGGFDLHDYSTSGDDDDNDDDGDALNPNSSASSIKSSGYSKMLGML